MLRALTWMKTLDKPRIKRFLFDSGDPTFPPVFLHLSRFCTFETVEFKEYAFFGKGNLDPSLLALEKWRKLFSSDFQFSSLLDGTTAIKCDRINTHENMLKLAPSTLTSLHITGHSGYWLHHLSSMRLTSLTLAEIYLSNDTSKNPLLLTGLASALPSLTKLKIDVLWSHPTNVVPLLEVPPNVTYLDIGAYYESPIPILIWPSPPALQRLTLGKCFRDPLALFAYRFNLYFLKHFCPNLTHIYARPIDLDSDYSDWKAFVAHVGPAMLARLLPPDYTPERAFLPPSTFATPSIPSTISDLPPLLTTLGLFANTSSDLHETLEALKLHSLRHLSRLDLALGKRPKDSDYPMPQLPSNITWLSVSETVTTSFVKYILPPSLTWLDASLSPRARLLIRDKFGSSLVVVSHMQVLDSNTLSLLYPPCESNTSTTAIGTGTIATTTATTDNTANATNSTTAQTKTSDSLADPLTPHHNLKMGPYGPYDECDAHGNWIVTRSSLKNALYRLFGPQTTATFFVPPDSEWPSSVTKLSFPALTEEEMLDIPFGISLAECGGTLSEESNCSALDIADLPRTFPPTLTSLKLYEPVSILNWGAIFEYAPHLTELNIPEYHMSLEDYDLPVGLRILHCKEVGHIYDYELRSVLQGPPQLVEVSFDAGNIIFTARDWNSPIFSTTPAVLAECLRPRANTKITVTVRHDFYKGVTVDVKLFPQSLTSLNMLAISKPLDLHMLPKSLTSYSGQYNANSPPPLDDLPLLMDYHYFQSGNTHPLPKFPSNLRSLCLLRLQDPLLWHYGWGKSLRTCRTNSSLCTVSTHFGCPIRPLKSVYWRSKGTGPSQCPPKPHSTCHLRTRLHRL